MSYSTVSTDRRKFLAASLAALPFARPPLANGFHRPTNDKALISITLDLEMSRHYPVWEQTHWDYEKGNLDTNTKKYSVAAARRVQQNGGLIHFFVVGRVFEQESVAWLNQIVQDGHSVGNHTYDHVNV